MTHESAFEFLDTLRETGITNMYGAGPYLQDEFGCSRKEAHAMMADWMASFARDVPASERAAQFATVNA